MTTAMEACRSADLRIVGPTDPATGIEDGVVVAHSLTSPRLEALPDGYRRIPSGPTHTIVVKGP